MMFIRSMILSLCLIWAIGAVGCSDRKLSRDHAFSTLNTGIDFCTTKPDTIKSNLKFIFVIDRSGSNQQDFDVTGNVVTPLPGTDPTGSRRFDAVIKFIQNFQTDPSVFYGMVKFDTTASTLLPFTNDAAAALTFFSDPVTGQKVLSPKLDRGWTDYLGALSEVYTLIQADVAKASVVTPIVSSDYVIFHISDGAPYIQGNILEDPATIIAKVQSIMALKDSNINYIDSIQLNTGYYYGTDNAGNPRIDGAAQSLLNQMALTGNGTALNFGNGQVIDLNRFSIPVRLAKFELRDIWLQNVNTVWFNGKLMQDSDGDGLPDDIENQMGSNPYKYDTDGDGVGDGVQYRLSGQPCAKANCAPASLPQVCSALPSPRADDDGDYLNNCEEVLLGSDPQNFDSNNDWIPDQFEFVNGVSFLKGTNDLLLDPDSDGITNYFELKMNTPIRTANNLLTGMQTMKYNAVKISETPSQSCYHYDITGLATLSPQDLIRVYVLENRGTVGQKPIMRSAQRPILGGVNFTDSDIIKH